MRHGRGVADLAEGDHRIRLRKGGAVVTPPAPIAHAAPPAAGPAAPIAEPVRPASKLLEIKSPMVGTFYAKPTPDKPDFVSVGSKVSANSVVCKLEAMKIFNDITADLSGTIAEVCVKNAQPVDYGTVLFRVEPS